MFKQFLCAIVKSVCFFFHFAGLICRLKEECLTDAQNNAKKSFAGFPRIDRITFPAKKTAAIWAAVFRFYFAEFIFCSADRVRSLCFYQLFSTQVIRSLQVRQNPQRLIPGQYSCT